MTEKTTMAHNLEATNDTASAASPMHRAVNVPLWLVMEAVRAAERISDETHQRLAIAEKNRDECAKSTGDAQEQVDRIKSDLEWRLKNLRLLEGLARAAEAGKQQ